MRGEREFGGGEGGGGGGGGGGWRCLHTMGRRDPTTVTLLRPLHQANWSSLLLHNDALEKEEARFQSQPTLPHN